MSRHPYTISLDRTKELVARDSPSSFRDFTRDPLKEIKDNPLRDPLRDPLGYRDSLRRPRLEVMGWAKPRLLNDDLSLPNVPGGKAHPRAFRDVIEQHGQQQPQEVGGWGRGWGVSESGSRSRRGGVTMPILSSIQRSSATSTESTPPTSPLANLPYV
ncbi:hypothetical protein C7M84_002507 [Penaeus vannamei]|uniref:Uncharacterized protein n=1 Tax=Penaeus vannamei TaxID=6689 RepID=A0A3R7PPQ2_PENVA|nr:hypothetical protein C7M84_002507 [Penaeus vannamei]